MSPTTPTKPRTLTTATSSISRSAHSQPSSWPAAVTVAAWIAVSALALACQPPPADTAYPTTSAPGEPTELGALLAEAERLMAKRTPSQLLASLEAFERATELLEPNSTRAPEAWSGLADVSALIGLYAVSPANEIMPKARAAAQRALELAPERARTHASLGLVLYLYDWDWPRAETHLRRAIELDPDYGSAHHWLAMLLTASGRHAEAVATMLDALEAEPNSRIIRVKAATVFLAAGDSDRALLQLEEAIQEDPDFALAHREMGYVLMERGAPDDAIVSMERAASLSSGSATTSAALALAYSKGGRLEDAHNTLTALEGSANTDRPIALHLATASIAVGDTEAAIRYVQQAHDERDPGLVYLESKPAFDPIRDDERFRAIADTVFASARSDGDESTD